MRGTQLARGGQRRTEGRGGGHAVRNTNLCDHKVGIIHNRVSFLDGPDGCWASAVASSLRALLLWSGVHCLPPVKPNWEVRPGQPHLIPHVEVPEHIQQMTTIILAILNMPPQALLPCSILPADTTMQCPSYGRTVGHHAALQRGPTPAALPALTTQSRSHCSDSPPSPQPHCSIRRWSGSC